MASLKLHVTTNNIRKLARFREILAPLGWEVLGHVMAERNLGANPQKLLKGLSEEAFELTRKSGLPSLADDSFFEVMDRGIPELLSVNLDQQMGEEERLKALGQRFSGCSVEQRRASFQTHMVLAWPDGRLESYSGQTHGIMLDAPRGGAGFGYDPMFLLLETGKTLAEMSATERDHFSPWERALRKLLEKYLLEGLEGQYKGLAVPVVASTPTSKTSGQRVLMATSNPGKIRELREALAGLGWELKSLLDFGFQLPPEDGLTFEDNALIKAAFACQQSGLMALADDSGLEVEALGGEPGVRSARFGGKESDTERNVYLLERLRGVPPQKRSARFVAVIALAYPDGNVEMYRGETKGRVLEAPRGTWGFGYDPLFVVEETGRTFAEMTISEKQQYSHRGKALAALMQSHRVKI